MSRRLQRSRLRANNNCRIACHAQRRARHSNQRQLFRDRNLLGIDAGQCRSCFRWNGITRTEGREKYVTRALPTATSWHGQSVEQNSQPGPAPKQRGRIKPNLLDRAIMSIPPFFNERLSLQCQSKYVQLIAGDAAISPRPPRSCLGGDVCVVVPNSWRHSISQ